MFKIQKQNLNDLDVNFSIFWNFMIFPKDFFLWVENMT